MEIKDYSQTENFNMAAIEAVVENFEVENMKAGIVSVVYKYKGRILKATAEVDLEGITLDGEPIIRSASILHVESFKGE